MFSTLRAGRGVCSWAKLSVRVSLTGQAGRRGGQQILKRFSANEAKTTVRGIPVESTRTGLTGKNTLNIFICT